MIPTLNSKKWNQVLIEIWHTHIYIHICVCVYAHAYMCINRILAQRSPTVALQFSKDFTPSHHFLLPCCALLFCNILNALNFVSNCFDLALYLLNHSMHTKTSKNYHKPEFVFSCFKKLKWRTLHTSKV